MKINKYYLIVLGIFLLFTVGSILVFFFSVQKQVEINARETINENVKRQSVHFQEIIGTQMEYLSAAAAYAGQQEDLFCQENEKLLWFLSEKTDLERTSIMNAGGVSHYDDGQEKIVFYREYFREALRGQANISDPVESMVDGESKVILCVPIWKEDRVIGALGGSYNVGNLSHILFEDIYDGVGYSMIATADGEIITLDGTEEYRRISEEDNLFEFYEDNKYSKSEFVRQMQADFASQSSGLLLEEYEGTTRYVAYEPMGLNDWMMCYVVPSEKAQEAYQLIRDVEMILYGVLLAAVAFLLVSLWCINSRNQKLLMKNAQTDLLTGVYNKKSTEEKVNAWLGSRECEGLQALLMLDIDRFKEINDVFGHLTGDEALREVGRLLNGCFRGGDIIGRIGGDEFVVLMKNITTPDQALYRAKQLLEGMKRLRVKGMEDHMITGSMGMAFSPQNGRKFMELYRCADLALYEIKQNGRDGCHVYGKEE